MSASVYCGHSAAWRKLHRKAKEEERRADDAEAPANTLLQTLLRAKTHLTFRPRLIRSVMHGHRGGAGHAGPRRRPLQRAAPPRRESVGRARHHRQDQGGGGGLTFLYPAVVVGRAHPPPFSSVPWRRGPPRAAFLLTAAGTVQPAVTVSLEQHRPAGRDFPGKLRSAPGAPRYRLAGGSPLWTRATHWHCRARIWAKATFCDAHHSGCKRKRVTLRLG